MDTNLGSLLTAIPASKKTTARTALINLREPANSILSDCFRQFGIDTFFLNRDAVQHLQKDKFEACVLPMEPAAAPIMEAIRTSSSNARMVIYGLGGDIHDAMRFSKYGVNVVFDEPLERSSALKLVRATQMLVLHEFRRYVRIPVITEVAVVTNDGRRFSATSQEISAGGMSLRGREQLSQGQGVEISFALLTLPRIWVRGWVTWRKNASQTFGMRFDPADERRLRIKEWIEAYLEG